MNKYPFWFTEQDVQYTIKLYNMSARITNQYCINYTKMMNKIHNTNMTAEEYKLACISQDPDMKWNMESHLGL